MEFFKGANGLAYLIGLLAVAMIIEAIMPWRHGVKIDLARWLRNASMAFYTMMIFTLLPVLADYGGAVTAQARGIGLFNQIAAPIWPQLVFSVLALDLLTYGQHRATHKWYIFWRLHRVHHSDTHIDATTSLRFHPMETIARAAVELPVIFLLGVPPEAILLSFAIQTFSNTITHTNIALPRSMDRLAAGIFVTPHIHRLHHSTAPEHQYSNFGTIFTFWDRLFGTYCGPENLRKNETFGIEGPEQMPRESFANLALDPFRTPERAAIPTPFHAAAARQESASDDP